MEKEDLLSAIKQRQALLYKRYRNACNEKDDWGDTLNKSTARNRRYTTRRDELVLRAIEELLLLCDVDFVDLSDDAMEGVMFLTEPCEKFLSIKKS